MREQKQQSYYIPLPEVLKRYSKRLSKLRQEVSEMKHYWKIRCEERKVLEKRLSYLADALKRTKAVEKHLSKLLNRKHFIIKDYKTHKDKRNNYHYPVFLSHNDCTRLRLLLRKEDKK